MTALYKQTFHTVRCEKLQYRSALACCIIWTEELFKTLQGHSWTMYKAITFCLFILWQEAYHMKGMKICLVDKWLSLHVIIFFLWPCTLLVSLIFQSWRRTYHFPLVLNLLHIQYNVLCCTVLMTFSLKATNRSYPKLCIITNNSTHFNI